MRPLATLACALLGLLPAATSAAAPETASTPRQFLWEVSSLTNKVYLYGTVHAGKASFYPLPQSVERAFADSTILAVEGDTVTYEVPCIGADGRLTRQTCRLSECVAVEDDEIRREFAGKERLL